jgi:hypothetical protein
VITPVLFRFQSTIDRDFQTIVQFFGSSVMSLASGSPREALITAKVISSFVCALDPSEARDPLG